jgi:predicted membrane-bound mannosyltransferase
MRATMLDIVTHLDYADFSIPLTVYYRWLYDFGGLSEWGMRLPLLLAGCALVVVGPMLARPWASLPVRATWAMFLAISPLLVYFSRIARPYALTTLLCIVAFIAFPRWLARDQHRERWSAAYATATVMAAWLHMTTLAFTLIPFLYFGVRAARVRHMSPLLKLRGDGDPARGRVAAAAGQ